ncbi:unnamed protein product [Protopolystoma xenopodis]|uniref:Uncharacterized protein n=1 Tax=Protopolystoma xenopodis TaxID=117903 RepID=A0A3S5AI63_9PLAT|nr:unnamed protein product [Protopolystoma xenopodis]
MYLQSRLTCSRAKCHEEFRPVPERHCKKETRPLNPVLEWDSRSGALSNHQSHLLPGLCSFAVLFITKVEQHCLQL